MALGRACDGEERVRRLEQWPLSRVRPLVGGSLVVAARVRAGTLCLPQLLCLQVRFESRRRVSASKAKRSLTRKPTRSLAASSSRRPSSRTPGLHRDTLTLPAARDRVHHACNTLTSLGVIPSPHCRSPFSTSIGHHGAASTFDLHLAQLGHCYATRLS